MKNGFKSILNKNVISIKYFNRNKWAFEILDKIESKLDIMEKSEKILFSDDVISYLQNPKYLAQHILSRRI